MAHRVRPRGRRSQVRVDHGKTDPPREWLGWYAPEIAFGLVYESIGTGTTVLDLGIGTGRSGALFRKAGCIVHGLDRSVADLKTCARNGLVANVCHDIRYSHLPFGSESHDMVICLGVICFAGHLENVMAEAYRVTKAGGRFVFTVEEPPELRMQDVAVECRGDETHRRDEIIYHEPSDVGECIDDVGFRAERCLSVRSKSLLDDRYVLNHKVYVVRRM